MTNHYHFIGIGGIGMSGLARILLEKKIHVSGSDIAHNYTIDGLVNAGAKIFHQQDEKNITPGSTIVYSTDIKNENAEFQHAKNN